MFRRRLQITSVFPTALCALMVVPAVAQDGSNGNESPDTIDDLVLYGIDDDSHSLVRYQFGDNQVDVIGSIGLAEVESLAYLKGSIHLYGVWNFEGLNRSRLVRINMLTAETVSLPHETGFGNVEGLTAVEQVNRGPGPDSPTQVILNDSRGDPAFEVSFVDITYNDDGTSSWTYNVRELDSGKDMSHWNLALDECHVVMESTTDGYEVGTDGSTGFYGIKWDVTDEFEEGQFTIVLDGHFAGTEGSQGVGVLAKGGNRADSGEIFGMTCNMPADGTLYGVHSEGSGVYQLISIDPQTGIGKLEMGLTRRYEGIAARADGSLMAVSDNQLYRLDPYSDVEEHIGTCDFVDSEALECAFGTHSSAIEIPGVDESYWSEGILFGFSDAENTLMMYDASTASAIPFASALAGLDIEGITFVMHARDPKIEVRATLFD